MAKRPELMITNGRLAGKCFVVKSGGLRLGRSSSNDIRVPDEELSRNHCLFEAVGETGIRLTDLASANGTILNGKSLGGASVALNVGDVIEVGETVVEVVDENGSVRGNSENRSGIVTPNPHSPLANVLRAFVVVLSAAAIYLVLNLKWSHEVPPPVKAMDEDPSVREVRYEKVEADSEGIFRFEMTFSRDGVLRVQVDDVPKENLHLSKSNPLGETACKTLNEILSFRTVKDLDREYVGDEPDPPALNSWTLTVVYENRSRTIRVVNTQEPTAFRALREKLDAFSKTELGVWATRYSRDRLALREPTENVLDVEDRVKEKSR